ncbi:uncharacterized protein A1O9_09172 [Exophiala aquamarina CBS 119918]|uniref:3-oxoacyl-[acyl-carrier protein] reductase n=1 Tax=Exophiala aquamarina CBS 119918 TaxID=1182545 RepID=A0A072PGR5_9EURO|nr:uncharacterized protein A1O9_09172 [Exophiala aquamarina CBS 119918]KEF54730.1 hypothetical protein A1O9_09172 [Exophiala aquamarina CBS 119918]
MASSDNKVAIVTGGVSGIGAQLTRTLIESGWVVVGLDIPAQEPLAQKLSDEFEDSFEFMSCDVTSYADLSLCFSKTFASRGRIDAFCSNAGLVDKSSLYVFESRGKTE